SPDERKDSLTPTYQVWVDGKDYGNVPIGQNVLRVTGVSYGPHKIVIAAKNTAGELIDRKEISVTTSEAQIAETRSMQTQIKTESAPAPAYVPPPAPAPQPQYTTESTTLPQTATSYPLALLAGLALIAAGVLLRRRLS
ncbi:MAG TPA: LPXTG cell wall anchor domain-containing protein, partial [Thermoanaerobaculia bacterium]